MLCPVELRARASVYLSSWSLLKIDYLQTFFNFRVGALKKNRGLLPSQIKDPIAPRFHSQSVAELNRKSFGDAERNSMSQQQSIDDLCFITRPYLELGRGLVGFSVSYNQDFWSRGFWSTGSDQYIFQVQSLERELRPEIL